MSEEEDRTCYVCNFVPEVTSDLLEELFTQVGPVEKLSVTDKNSYRFAMVTFEDEESVPFAVETLDGIKLFKIPLTVKPRNGSKHDRRNSDSVRRESYGSSHSSPYSESRKRDHMGRTMSYDERLNRSYSASRSETNLMFTPPVPPPPPPPPPLPPHSDSYPSLKTRSSMPNDKYNTPKSSYSGRLPGGDQRRTFPSKPSDTRVFEDSNDYGRWRGGGRGNYRDNSRYSSRGNSYSNHRWH